MPFFFFFFHAFSPTSGTVYVWYMNSNHNFWPSFMNSISVHCLRTHKFHFLSNFLLKMGLIVLFTHLKIILLQYFQFSIFSFSKISSIQTKPISCNILKKEKKKKWCTTWTGNMYSLKQTKRFTWGRDLIANGALNEHIWPRRQLFHPWEKTRSLQKWHHLVNKMESDLSL